MMLLRGVTFAFSKILDRPSVTEDGRLEKRRAKADVEGLEGRASV